MGSRNVLVRNMLCTVTVILLALLAGVRGSHFRGGTISWKSEGGTKVHFFFKLGWAYGRGPGCIRELIGRQVGSMTESWMCQSNNCGLQNRNDLHDVNYICTGADVKEDWEQGKKDFTFNFPSTGPFTVGYTSGNWITLSDKRGNGKWNLATTIDLGTRSDTGHPNSSPESQSKPIYHVPYNCEVHIQLPIIDQDNDNVKCRWAKSKECATVCNALPSAVLDEETCTLSFNTTAENGYEEPGMYAVALTIEDHPRIPMTLGAHVKKSPNDVLSSIPLQFLVHTIIQPCGAGPQFVDPTPKEKQVITVEGGHELKVKLYADNKNDTSAKANDITASGPLGMTVSAVTLDTTRSDTYMATAIWQTTANDTGSHIVCAHVNNDKGMSGTQRCFTIDVVAKGCVSLPCQNNGKCVTNNYMCVCRPGFTGHDCEVNIDDCESEICPEGTFCIDGINTYTCQKNTTCTCP